MIPFNFDYYRPDTIDEAVQIYKELENKGKSPIYYGGGSEIISMARAHKLYTQAVIDLKAIPECNMLEFQSKQLVIGSCVTLSNISESKLFPLLGKACGRIADHTMQCKITLGGNIAGTIIYRETVLPLLLTDCQVVFAGNDKPVKLSIHDVFKERLLLPKSCFIVQFIIEKEYTALPYIHVKKTKNEKIDYPLISVAALKKDETIRLAMSGVCQFPFRSPEAEYCVNNNNLPIEARAAKAIEILPAPVLNDNSGSNQFRKYILKNTLINTLETLEEVN